MPKFKVELRAPACFHVIVKAPTREAAKAWADEKGFDHVMDHEPHFDREDDFLDSDGTETGSVKLMRKNAPGSVDVAVDEKGEEL